MTRRTASSTVMSAAVRGATTGFLAAATIAAMIAGSGSTLTASGSGAASANSNTRVSLVTAAAPAGEQKCNFNKKRKKDEKVGCTKLDYPTTKKGPNFNDKVGGGMVGCAADLTYGGLGAAGDNVREKMKDGAKKALKKAGKKLMGPIGAAAGCGKGAIDGWKKAK